MNIPVACVLVAGVMPVLGAAMAKWGFKDFDNHNPRQWLAAQTGFRARANAAQNNNFEAFPFFAIAVVLALHFQAHAVWLDPLCLLFVAARVLYFLSYVLDWAKSRTLCWTLAYGACIAIYVQLI
jgi:uncharacterized MAPEG superfamily protein